MAAHRFPHRAERPPSKIVLGKRMNQSLGGHMQFLVWAAIIGSTVLLPGSVYAHDWRDRRAYDWDQSYGYVRPSPEWYRWQRTQRRLNDSGFSGCIRRPSFNNAGQVIGSHVQCQ
jgi:hypothetical protein